jgi:hypothetical protein
MFITDVKQSLKMILQEFCIFQNHDREWTVHWLLLYTQQSVSFLCDTLFLPLT